jgi:hypothetical protein
VSVIIVSPVVPVVVVSIIMVSVLIPSVPIMVVSVSASPSSFLFALHAVIVKAKQAEIKANLKVVVFIAIVFNVD